MKLGRTALVLVGGATSVSGCLGILGGDIDFTGKGTGGAGGATATTSSTAATATGGTATSSTGTGLGGMTTSSGTGATTTTSSTGTGEMDAGDAGPTVWAKRYPSMGGASAGGSVRSIRVDHAGNVILTGLFSGSVDFGCGSLLAAGVGAVFVAKLDSSGTCLWNKQFGSVSELRVDSIAVDTTAGATAGDIAISGLFFGTISFGGAPLTSGMACGATAFVAKFDASGTPLWSKQFGDGSGQEVTAVGIDSAGDIVATGYAQGVIDFGQGNVGGGGANANFLAKLASSSGTGVWSMSLGPGSAPVLSVDASDSVIVTGESGTANLGNGCNVVPGIFLAKFDTNGKCAWADSYGTANDQTADDIAVDSTGEVVISGEITSSSIKFGTTQLSTPGIFLAKFDSFGTSLWAKEFAGATHLDEVAIQADDSIGLTVFCQMDNVDLGGGSLGPDSSGICMGHYDGSGNHLWSKQFPCSPPGFGGVVTLTPDTISPAFVLGGSINSPVDFGTGPLTSAMSNNNPFVAKVIQ